VKRAIARGHAKRRSKRSRQIETFGRYGFNKSTPSPTDPLLPDGVSRRTIPR